MKSKTLLLVAIALLSGCSKSPPTGKEVSLQLRRGDALGSGANLPVPPRTSGINGAETGLSGKLVKITDEWVVIDTNDIPAARIWIPKGNILLIEYRTK
jgi:hypothetical protein